MTENERRELEFKVRRYSERYCGLVEYYDEDYKLLTPEELAELRSHLDFLKTEMVRMNRLLEAGIVGTAR